MLINVTIAILLEKMVDDGSEKMEEAQRNAYLAQEAARLGLDEGLRIAADDVGAVNPSDWQLERDECGSDVLQFEGEVNQMRRDMSVLRQGLEDVLFALKTESHKRPIHTAAVDRSSPAVATELEALEVASVTSDREFKE